MKTLLAIALILCSFCLKAQKTVVSFSVPDQEFEYSKETTEIKIKLSIENLGDQYDSDKDINLQVFSSLEKPGIFNEPTQSSGKDIIIIPASIDDSYSFTIPLIIDKAIDNQSVRLTLKKKGLNTAFIIGRETHSIVFRKKKEKPKGKVSIISTSESIDFDLSKDEAIELPFKIVSTGYVPIEKDSVTLSIKIKDIETYNEKIKDFKVVGIEMAEKIILREKDDKKLFREFTGKLKEAEKITIEIKKLNEKSENEIKLDDKKKSISYSLNKKNSDSNQYSFYLGTNFDLQEQFEATSFYSEIDAWLPNLINDKWGVRAGLYKNNNSRSLDESSRIESTRQIISQTTDSITFQTTRVQSIPNVKIENFGLYLEVLFKLIDEKNFTGHLAGHFEAIERNEDWTYENDDLIAFQSSTISLDSLERDRRLLSELSRSRNFSRRYFDSYYGVGFPMNYRNTKNNFTIFLNPVFGFGDPGLFFTPVDDRKLKGYGIFQFSLIEESFGVKLSGEIRKYFDEFHQSIVSVNISKRINLEKIFDSSSDD
tara:strand:- start:10307 stop:11926 length:1620 start_codon:yes stop_codon:yes gene_type:complete